MRPAAIPVEEVFHLALHIGRSLWIITLASPSARPSIKPVRDPSQNIGSAFTEAERDVVLCGSDVGPCDIYAVGLDADRGRGMYLPITAKGRIKEILSHWPEKDVRFIVATDGERILGLGDQGVGAMRISFGKPALYTACAGVPPRLTLPITLDVGTNRQAVLDDPLYLGVRQHRVRGAEYDAFIEDYVQVVQELFHPVGGFCKLQRRPDSRPLPRQIMQPTMTSGSFSSKVGQPRQASRG
jgi:hypothetical protein